MVQLIRHEPQSPVSVQFVSDSVKEIPMAPEDFQIIRLISLLTLNVYDDGYSRIALCTLGIYDIINNVKCNKKKEGLY